MNKTDGIIAVEMHFKKQMLAVIIVCCVQVDQAVLNNREHHFEIFCIP